jgi:TetR/AcrR family transcriptional repressor of nem operon
MVSRSSAPSIAAGQRAARAAEPRFVDVLLDRQQRATDRRKGERTRDRLKLGAVQSLEQRGYLQLRVADICKKAKVAHSVFYIYFKNKEEITVEVLTEFLAHTFQLDEPPGEQRPRTLFDALQAVNLRWIRAVRANAGLTRCLLQLSDQVPEFKELTSRMNHEWFLSVTDRTVRRFPHVKIDKDALLLAQFALGGMMDEFCDKLLVSREEHLVELVERVAPTDEALAEFLSTLWYRALFAADPPQHKFEAGRALRALAGAATPSR